MREIREEVEQREKQHYSKMLESMRAREIMALREEIAEQYQKKYKKDSEKIMKRYQDLVKASKTNDQPSKLKE